MSAQAFSAAWQPIVAIQHSTETQRVCSFPASVTKGKWVPVRCGWQYYPTLISEVRHVTSVCGGLPQVGLGLRPGTRNRLLLVAQMWRWWWWQYQSPFTPRNDVQSNLDMKHMVRCPKAIHCAKYPHIERPLSGDVQFRPPNPIHVTKYSLIDH